MRLYLFGLLSGLLIATVVGVVACGPVVGPGDGGNGPGVKIGALKVQDLPVDCSNLTPFANQRGTKVDVDLDAVVSAQIRYIHSSGDLVVGNALMGKAGSDTLVSCDTSWKSITLRLAVK